MHCVQVNLEVVVVAAGACLYVYESEVVVGRVVPVYWVDLRNVVGVDLLGDFFRYFDFIN